jgi:hypothetical protein
MFWENVLCWIEAHPGLASWLQAFGAIVSIWAAFAISRFQQKAQLLVAARAAQEKFDAMKAVVESAVLYATALGDFLQEKPNRSHFKENWKLINGQWLEASIFTLSQIPVYELGQVHLVRGYFGIFGSMNEIQRLVSRSFGVENFQDQEHVYMRDEVLKQVRLVEGYWRSFQSLSSQ